MIPILGLENMDNYSLADSAVPALDAPRASALAVLKRRALSAAGHTMVGHGLTHVLRLGSNLITTRLLLPDMFGVMAIAQTVIVGLSLLSDMGLSQSIIQSRHGEEARFLNTAWVVQILRGGVILALTLLASLLLYLGNLVGWVPEGTAYAAPVLPFVTAALSLTVLISGFESTKMSLSIRNLGLGPVIRVELFSHLCATATMVIWAYLERSAWALVGGWIVGALVKTALSHLALPGANNRLEWDPDALREIVHFGKWVFLSSILTFLVTNGDRLLLGGFLKPETLGLYSVAFLIVSAVQQSLSRLAGYVAYPVFSTVVRQRSGVLRQVYYQVRLPIDLAYLFGAGLFFGIGPWLIGLLYDHRYASAGQMLQTLGLTLVASRYEVLDQCLLALGKPRLLTLMNLCRLFVLYGATPIAFHLFGLPGALWAIVASAFGGLPLGLYLKARLGLLNPAREMLSLAFFLIVAASAYWLGMGPAHRP